MDLLIALFSIAGLVWMVPVVQRGRLIMIATLLLGVGTVFGPPFFAIDGPIQFSLDRLIWIAMIGLALAGWRLGYARIPEWNRFDWLLIGIVGWFFVSALRGGPVPTGSSPVARWLFYIAMPAGMYGFARIVDIRRRDITLMLGGSVALGLYLAVMAMLEIAGAHSFVFPSFIADPDAWEFFGRGRGPLMNPSGNGFLISMSLVAAMLGFLYAGRRGKLLYAVIAVILLGGVYATLTRSAWMGAFAAIAMMGMVYAPRWARVLGLATVVVLGAASLSGMKDQFIRMKRDKNLTASDAEQSIKLRPLLAVVAWEMFQDRPIIGHGYGHYFEHSGRYHNDRSYHLPLEQARSYAQHNVFLSILVDTGLVGLSMFTAWLAMLAAIGWRLARGAIDRPGPGLAEARRFGMLLLSTIVAYLCNGMFQDVMIIPMVHMFLFFLAGVAVTIHQTGFAVRSTPEKRAQATCGAAPATA